MALKTVLEALASWSSVQPDKPCWTFLSDKAEPMDSFTYMVNTLSVALRLNFKVTLSLHTPFQELDRTTSLAARHLLEKHNLRKGDRVLLVFFPGLHFTVSLLACFKAGLIAVPVFPPDPRKMKKDLDHFINIQMSSGAKTALTNAEFNFAKKVENLKCMFSRDAKAWPELTWIQMDEVMQKGKSSTAATGDLPAVGMNDIAFLQYTSGSTSEPKGVMISHENLSHNLAMIIHELRANTETINVSWLPQYHDMGLIGKILF